MEEVSVNVFLYLRNDFIVSEKQYTFRKSNIVLQKYNGQTCQIVKLVLNIIIGSSKIVLFLPEFVFIKTQMLALKRTKKK
jgi:hypothetical protein